MRVLLAALIATLLGHAQIAQAELMLNELYGFNRIEIAAVVPATVTFLQCAENSTDLTTYTFSSQNVGTATADRVTVIGIMARDAATVFDVSTVTVGGASAGELTDEAGTGPQDISLYSVSNPAGTSEDVVVTFSEVISNTAICLWQVNNSATAASDTATLFDTNSGAMSLDTDVPADGVAVGICGAGGSGGSATWAGLTERVDDSEIGSDLNATYNAADFDNDATADTPLSITATLAGTNDGVCTVASFNHL